MRLLDKGQYLLNSPVIKAHLGYDRPTPRSRCQSDSINGPLNASQSARAAAIPVISAGASHTRSQVSPRSSER